MREDEVPKHRKRRGGKKPYTIEYRCKPDSAGHRLFGDDWIVWKRYETEARRDTAMKALTSCEAHFEHRKGET